MNSSGSAGATPISAMSSPRVEHGLRVEAVVAADEEGLVLGRAGERVRAVEAAAGKSASSGAGRAWSARLFGSKTTHCSSPSSVRREHRHQPPHAELAVVGVARERARRGQADAVPLAQEDVDAERVQLVVAAPARRRRRRRRRRPRARWTGRTGRRGAARGRATIPAANGGRVHPHRRVAQVVRADDVEPRVIGRRERRSRTPTRQRTMRRWSSPGGTSSSTTNALRRTPRARPAAAGSRRSSRARSGRSDRAASPASVGRLGLLAPSSTSTQVAKDGPRERRRVERRPRAAGAAPARTGPARPAWRLRRASRTACTPSARPRSPSTQSASKKSSGMRSP